MQKSPARKSPSIRPWSILVLMLVASVLICCQASGDLVPKEFGFNLAMKPDGNIETQQPTGVMSFNYSSGRKRAMDTMTPSPSEIYPVPPGFVEGDLLERSLRKLRRSRFYWTAVDERIMVSWEFVAKGLSLNGVACEPPDAGACDMRDPGSRRRLECDNHTFDVWNTPVGNSLNLELCGQSRNAFNDPQESQQNCHPVEDTCGFDSNHPRHDHFPFCQFNCPLEPFSGTYQLRALAGTTELAKRSLFPSIVKVPYSADLARQMESLTQEEPTGDLSFQFTVSDFDGKPIESNSDKLWRENFSPALRTSRVRIFVEDANAPGGRRYLQPSNLNITSVAPSGDPNPNPIDCPPDPGIAEFSPRTCFQLGNATPTYMDPAFQDRLVWKVRVPRAQQGQPELTNEDKVFIEFTVATRNHGEHGMWINACPTNSDPARPCMPIDLGFIDTGRQTRFPNQFRIGNSGSQVIRLENIRITPRNAFGTSGSFEVELPGNRTFPFELPGGTDIPVTIVARPNGNDELQSEVAFDYQAITAGGSGQGALQTVVGTITARAWDTVLNLTPRSLEFNEQTRMRSVLASNDGNNIAQIFSADVVGLNVSAFRMLVSPSSYPVVLPPGDSVIYRFELVPDYSTRSISGQEIKNSATLVLQTNAGEKRIPLSGTATVDPTKIVRTPNIRMNSNRR